MQKKLFRDGCDILDIGGEDNPGSKEMILIMNGNFPTLSK